MSALGSVGSLLVGGFARARTWTGLVYLLAGLPLGVISATVVVTGVATGIGLLVLVIGLPLIWASMAGSLIAARLDAALGRRLLDPAIPTPPPVPALTPGATLRSMGRLCISGRAWRSLLWHLLRALSGTLALAVVCALLMAGYGLVVQAGWGALYDAQAWVRLLAVVGGVALILVIPYVVDGFATWIGSAAGPLLRESAAERLKEETERSATAEARVDLARDLHDSVGHSVTAAVLQASAARRTLRSDPAFAEQALEAIEERGRAALEELDRVLAMMRDEGASTRRDEGLHLIDELIGSAREAGQPITLTRNGDLAAVPPAVAREGFRVVQEGVTNAMRHAAGAPTAVSLASAEGRLVIDVVNGPGEALHPDRDSGGRGLAGVAERARVFGGSVTSGPMSDGGFRLRVELPFGGDGG